MLLCQSERRAKLLCRQAVILGNLQFRLEPDLGLARQMLNMNVIARFFPRKEKKRNSATRKRSDSHSLKIQCLPDIILGWSILYGVGSELGTVRPRLE